MKKDEIQTFSYRISQANKTQLIVIMYDMAIQYVSDAIENNYETQAEKDEYESDVVQVKRVVDSLVTSLDMQYEVSVQLVKAVAKKDKNTIMLLESVKKMLETMRKSFYELSKQDDSEPLMKNTQQVYAGFTYSNDGGSNEYSKGYENRGYKV